MVTNRLGMGAMIRLLAGDQDSVETFRSCMGKQISALALDPQANGGDGGLVFTFNDRSRMMLADNARSCCEHRYMTTDDELEDFVGATLLDAEVRKGSVEDAGYGVIETAFLEVVTDLGRITCTTYNEHNGYYGGIEVRAQMLESAGAAQG